MTPEETLVYHGAEVKALPDGKIGGYLVRFSTAKDPDLSRKRDFFTPETDFGPHLTSLVWYNHAQDGTVKRLCLDTAAKLKKDDVGVWIEAQLDLRDRYARAIHDLAAKGKLGWSSGSAPHLVEREEEDGAHKILAWPLGLDASLTPTPAEPRTCAVALKSLPSPPSLAELVPELKMAEAGTDGDALEGEEEDDSEEQIERLSAIHQDVGDVADALKEAHSRLGEHVKQCRKSIPADSTKSPWVGASLDDVPFEDALKAALGAVEGVAARARQIHTLRAPKRRTVGAARIDDLKQITAGLQDILSDIEALAGAPDPIPSREGASGRASAAGVRADFERIRMAGQLARVQPPAPSQGE